MVYKIVVIETDTSLRIVQLICNKGENSGKAWQDFPQHSNETMVIYFIVRQVKSVNVCPLCIVAYKCKIPWPMNGGVREEKWRKKRYLQGGQNWPPLQLGIRYKDNLIFTLSRIIMSQNYFRPVFIAIWSIYSKPGKDSMEHVASTTHTNSCTCIT